MFTCTLCVYVAVRFDRDPATGAGGTRVGLRAVAAVLPNGVLCVYMYSVCLRVLCVFTCTLCVFTLQYDSTVTLRREPVVLESGYEQWLLYYPMVYSVFTCSLCVYVAVRFDRDPATGAGGTRVGLRAVAAVLPNGVLCVYVFSLCLRCSMIRP